jgi:hypothetical protein
MQKRLKIQELQEQRILRIKTSLWPILGAFGGLCSCFDRFGEPPTHVPTEETFDLIERALELLNQAVATLRKKPDLRALQ